MAKTYQSKKFLTIALFIFISNVYANENIRMFWSLGDIGVSWHGTQEDLIACPFMNVGNINWITTHGLGWGFNIFNIEGSTNWNKALILPAEISFSPFGDNAKKMFLTFYGRGGWMLSFDSEIKGSVFERSSLFGAAGLRAAWFPTVGEYWSIFSGAFIEYTSKNELRLGFSIDTTVLVALTAIVFGIALSESGK